MKNLSVPRLLRRLLPLLLLALISCGDYFKDPFRDRENGDYINLLIVDFNFFKTFITCRVYDATTREVIAKPAVVRFTGKNGNDIVTFAGTKRDKFDITLGRLELTADPSVAISQQTPFDFAVSVEADGYLPMQKGFTLLSTGKKSIDIYLMKASEQSGNNLEGGIKINNGDTTIIFGKNIAALKTAALEKPYKISYSISLSDFLLLKDQSGNLLFNSSKELLDAYNANPTGFMYIHTTASGEYPAWIDRMLTGESVSSVILHILESGSIEYLMVNGNKVTGLNGGKLNASFQYTGLPAPQYAGFSTFATEHWNTPSANAVYAAIPASYTIIEASAANFCSTGATIRFESNVSSSFNLSADVYDMNNKLLFTHIFTGSFPASFVMENTPPIPVKLKFRSNNPAFSDIPDLVIANFCEGTYTVAILPKPGYVGYQIVLKAFCENNPQVAVAPTYNGEFRLANSSDPWQGAFMTGGVVDLLGLPNREYEYRILWENEWETTTFHTQFNADGSYAFPTSSKITSEKMADGRTRINISHTFKQNVCETMNW